MKMKAIETTKGGRRNGGSNHLCTTSLWCFGMQDCDSSDSRENAANERSIQGREACRSAVSGKYTCLIFFVKTEHRGLNLDQENPSL